MGTPWNSIIGTAMNWACGHLTRGSCAQITNLPRLMSQSALSFTALIGASCIRKYIRGQPQPTCSFCDGLHLVKRDLLACGRLTRNLSFAARRYVTGVAKRRDARAAPALQSDTRATLCKTVCDKRAASTTMILRNSRPQDQERMHVSYC